MIRWFFKFVFMSLLGAGIYFVAFREAPDLKLMGERSEQLAASLPARGGEPEIRILIAEAVDVARLTINGKVRMEAVTMQMQQRSGEFSQNIQVDVTPTGAGIKIGADRYVRARIRSIDAQPLKLSWQVGGKDVNFQLTHQIEMYGTHVTVGGKKIAKLRIIARAPLEEYLYGVVPSEMPSRWPLEALRAQAVASRTYAYFQIRSKQGEEYDVKSTVQSQVWRPSPLVELSVRGAVDSTRGIVITEKNALIQTFFHSECGGFTADARWVFTKTPILALSGVRCPRCSNSANKPYTWKVTYTREEILARLKKAGLYKRGGEIRMIQALDHNSHPMSRQGIGRVVTIEITLAGGSGATLRIPMNDFRLAIGTDKTDIASSYMTIESGGENRITFSGIGWGHGVGLCQHGAAYAASKLSYDFLDILALYYPGSKPVRLWGAAR